MFHAMTESCYFADDLSNSLFKRTNYISPFFQFVVRDIIYFLLEETFLFHTSPSNRFEMSKHVLQEEEVKNLITTQLTGKIFYILLL